MAVLGKKLFERNMQRRSLIKDVKIFFLALWVISIWRGIWNFLDHFLFPDFFVFSNILSILIWVLILFLNDNNLTELAGDE